MSDHHAHADHRSQSHLLHQQRRQVCQSEYRSTRC
ncbi:hypothetical protein [Escherichia phage ZCEC13]|uniref:Uncharacterized protein n=1 Tax=Escherichia phage ZCEC13 TaxID=2935866 RepID=A0AAE9KRR8_9CAUD|nr:hypothetical protein [Escherichia phage ZCEC13]